MPRHRLLPTAWRRIAAASSAAGRERDKLRALFDQSFVAEALLEGPLHTFVYANAAYGMLVGRDDVVGKTLLEALPDIAGQGFDRLLDGVVATGIPFRGNEVPVKLAQHAGDEVLYVNVLYAPKRNALGVIDGIVVSAVDVTPQVVARHAAEATARALRSADAIMRSMVDNVPELAWSARPDGFIDFYNQRWYEFTGTTPSDMEGWGWKAVHDPKIVDEVVARWSASVASGEKFEMEFPLRRHDGQLHWFLTRVHPLRDANGAIVRWFGTNTNIHEQRETARRAEEVSVAKDEFLATASHELRTPLNAILGWARMLQSPAVDAAMQKKGVDTIERNARAQVRLIEDILDGSRMITGKLHLEIRPLDLTALVRAALDAVRPAADAKGIAVNLALDPAAARIVGDPERLQQVIWNLANNAVKFTPRGGAVAISLQQSGTHIELAVQDTGKGIEADFLPHVFERFRQAEGSTTRRHGGLGLGLALVRHLIEAHGGTVRAESRGVGLGARFVALLPVQAVFEESADARHPASARERPALVVDGQRLAGVHALVVDDELDARDLVSTVLRAHGASVTTAASALEALATLSVVQPTVLVSDVGMPEVDGYELLRRARAVGHTLPAIALTAYSREQDRRLALAAGFDLHVSKPVEPGELVRVVERVGQLPPR